ncbi:MinD/ParA family ATP-binding protein [Parasphingorhabdus pacifica]
MTGRYEESETPSADSAETSAGVGHEHSMPDYGDSPAQPVGRYAEPRTKPSAQPPDFEAYPAQPGATEQQPGYGVTAEPQQPSGGARSAESSMPQSFPQPGGQFGEASPSGPQQQGAPPGSYPTAGGTSGPYPVTGGASGPYPVTGASGPYPVDPGQNYNQPFPQSQQASPPPNQPFPQPHQAPPQPNQPFPQPQQTPGYPPQQPPQPNAATGAAGGGEQPFGQDLSSAQLLRPNKRTPQSGWRRAVYVASGRSINLGESSADLRRRELISRINQPLHGCYKIAMLSLKGGVGKTTTTATLGSTFSSLRGDRVIAVDANPDRGTLSQKIPLETTATVRHLLRDAQRVRKYSDVRAYTSQGPSRLEILASEQDPAVSEAFSEADYRKTVTLLEHFYNVVLTDCGTGLMHSAMKGVLDVADSLVIVSPGSIDGARSASATLDWLDAHGYGELVARSVAVINSVRPGSGKVDVDKLSAHFASRCRAVSKIPFDPHLEEGAEVDLDQLAASTRMALLELGAIVADDFPYAFGRQQQV